MYIYTSISIASQSRALIVFDAYLAVLYNQCHYISQDESFLYNKQSHLLSYNSKRAVSSATLHMEPNTGPAQLHKMEPSASTQDVHPKLSPNGDLSRPVP